MAAQVIHGREQPGPAKDAIDHWGLFKAADGSVRLAGTINGGATPFRTSDVAEIDSLGRWVRTQNSVYALGQPNERAAAAALAVVDGPQHGRRHVPLPPPPARAAGFQTARGSLYVVGEDGRTTRLKRSSGKGHGEVHEPSMALYVRPEHAQQLLPLMPAVESLKVGAHNPKTGDFREFEHGIAVPSGWTPVVAVFDRATGQFLRACPAETTPRVGLNPVEKHYSWEANGDRIGTTHVGNTIARLLDRATLEREWQAAGGPALPAAAPVEGFAGRLARTRRFQPDPSAPTVAAPTR